MKFRKNSSKTCSLGTAVAFLAALRTAAAHSWVEYAYKIAPNGTMVGNVGYPRGWLPRNSTNPVWNDKIPQLILPQSGQAFYQGDEILNKYKFEPNPTYPMLEAAAGDHVALMHLENGHTTLPQNQPLKPHNRGTIYFYGTSKPNQEEKLFDVHLLWNRDGTGGDGRGVLLGTRNYDDGQCYQPNAGPLSEGRASELAANGAKHDEELACQSDLKLPDDLQPGSIYTIYWYWDWPDLNGEKINMEATTNGIYPWAGTFMRGDKDPNGFTMDAIARNESYASTVDVKIVASAVLGSSMKSVKGSKFIAAQNVYSMAIQAQMKNNFQVDVHVDKGGSGSGSIEPPTPTTLAPGPSTGDKVVTVTMFSTVPPTTVVTTVYRTVPAESIPSSQKPISTSTLKPSTLIVTRTTHVLPVPNPTSTSTSTPSTLVVTRTTHVSPVSKKSTSTGISTPSIRIVTRTTHVQARPTTAVGHLFGNSTAIAPAITRTPRARRSSWGFGLF